MRTVIKIGKVQVFLYSLPLTLCVGGVGGWQMHGQFHLTLATP